MHFVARGQSFLSHDHAGHSKKFSCLLCEVPNDVLKTRKTTPDDWLLTSPDHNFNSVDENKSMMSPHLLPFDKPDICIPTLHTFDGVETKAYK